MARNVRTTTIVLLAVTMLAALLGLLPGTTGTAAGVGEPALGYTPTEGDTGTAISVQGQDCLLPEATTGADGVIVALETDAGDRLAAATIPVDRDGRFDGELVVPAGTPIGRHRLTGVCVSPELPDLVQYLGGPFTVTGEGDGALTVEQSAAAQPAAGGIEPYPSYDGQTTCSPAAKPGTLTFSRRTLATFTNTGTYGISRDCSIGGTSEHKEGRAWDWKADVNNRAERRSVTTMLRWLLATDAQGNRHAMARRLGIMYIIWNRKMFRLYRAGDGWQPYTGSSPHTDHVHISLTRAGGNKTTSYWSMRNAPPWGGVGASPPPQPPPPSGPRPASFRQTRRDIGGYYTPVPGDFDGDGREDIMWYGSGGRPDYLWWAKRGGGFVGTRITVRRTFVPLVGDFDGDGRDDIIWYGVGGRPDYIWWGSANRRFLSQSISVGGVYNPPVTGDFDGDGRDDVFWYGKGAAKDWIWWGAANRRFEGSATSVSGSYTPPFTGDFDGDGRDDIYWYGKGGASDFKWFGRADRGFDGSTAAMALSRRPLSGNFNGDRRDDVFWYAPKAPKDLLWLGASGRGFGAQAITNVSGTYNGAFVADLDGNGRDDIYWYAPGSGADYIWWF